MDSGALLLTIKRRYAEHAQAWLKSVGGVKLRWFPQSLGG